MPLLKKKSFTLLEPPKNLESHELVYQIRFTKEIFLGYQEYLNRINLYRQRIWTCKISGKGNLTYEEALVSEKQATEKVQQIPEELVSPALHIIQFSMLSLKDLADRIAAELQEHLFVGAELHGRKGDDLCPCKIVKVVDDGIEKTQYKIAWLDKNKKIMETSVVGGDVLIRRKFPFSRSVLKSFIRESTYRSAPWVLHAKLGQNYGIPTDPPLELKDEVFVLDGLVVCNKKRRKNAGEVEEPGKCKKKKEGEDVEAANMEKNNKRERDQPDGEPIKYPIDDLLVKPGPNDPAFAERPLPSTDFSVPMDSIGDLLMVWDFCSSFSRLLYLWPFCLEDFEKAICHKDSNLTLIVETHSAFLRLLIKDGGEYYLAVKKRNRKLKITLINWTEYLLDFLDMINIPDLSTYTTTIKRGHYGILDAQGKLKILKELVNQALETNLVRDKLDESIEQRQMLGATRREEALAEARMKRGEKELLKAESVANGVMNGDSLENVGMANENHFNQNGNTIKKRKGEVISSPMNLEPDKSGSNPLDTSSKKTGKRQNLDGEVLGENRKDSSRKEALKQLKDERKEAPEKRSKQQRREYYEREMEKRVVRANSLGKDRYYSRYWWFRRDGRIFVESSDSKLWGYYSSKEELDALMGLLNHKGERERALYKQLEKFYSRICAELQKRSKDVGQKIGMEEEAVLRRSTRVRAMPRENPANAFLRYVNKWKLKED